MEQVLHFYVSYALNSANKIVSMHCYIFRTGILTKRFRILPSRNCRTAIAFALGVKLKLVASLSLSLRSENQTLSCSSLTSNTIIPPLC